MAIATSAVRDADNGDAFVAELRERFALSARVLGGDEEARLTYLGATASDRPDGADPGDRHRRRLDRADRRHRLGDRLPRHRCRRASSATPSATSLSDPPATPRARGARRGHPRADREGGRRTARRRPAGRRSPWPAPPLRWRRSSSSSTPTTPSGSTATRLTLPGIQHLLSQLASVPLAERAGDRRHAPGPGADDRRRHRDPDRDDARLRARPDRRLRARHLVRSGAYRPL